jgi:hypothetical protein
MDHKPILHNSALKLSTPQIQKPIQFLFVNLRFQKSVLQKNPHSRIGLNAYAIKLVDLHIQMRK